MGEPGQPQVPEIMERALQLAEETLEQIAKIAVEQIRRGVESSHHVDAAERDMRSALRQLVLAQRDWQTKSSARPIAVGKHDEVIAKMTPNGSP
jgi:outer membrane protein TolC